MVNQYFFISPQEGDAIDEELDKQEILEPASNELAGEELLEKEYMTVSAPTKCSNWSLDHKSLITNFGFAYN